MNIFYLDDDLETSVKYHVDKHITKMPLEAAQLVCTTSWIDLCFGKIDLARKLNKEELAELADFVAPYRNRNKGIPPANRNSPVAYWPSYINHPCAIWLRTSFENWCYTVSYAFELDYERHLRFGSVEHSSVSIIKKVHVPRHLTSRGQTRIVEAVGDCPIYDDPVDTYRHYYIHYKNHLAEWSLRPKPTWYNEEYYPCIVPQKS